MYGLTTNQLMGMRTRGDVDETKERKLQDQIKALRLELAQEKGLKAGYTALLTAVEKALAEVSPNHPLLVDEEECLANKIFEEAANNLDARL